MTAVEYWFDFASPYAYLLAERVEAALAPHDAIVVWKPVVLSALPGYGGYGPNGALRQRYVGQDVLRSAAYHGLPIAMPDPFPVRSALALAATPAAIAAGMGAAYVRRVLRAAWTEAVDIGDPAVLARCVRDAGGDAEAVLAAAEAPEAAARLDALAAEADRAGVFGVPTMVLDGELFWGNDRLDHLLWRLGRAGGGRR